MYRVTARNTPRACKVACNAPSRSLYTTTPFFPHFGHAPFGALGNDVFRLLDTATADFFPPTSRHAARRNFNPRFDVKEAGSSYQLQGELPGFEQKDLDIEFVDERTLVIKGRMTNATTESDASEQKDQQKAVAADATSDAASENSAKYQKATVEDEYVDAGAESEKAQADANEVSKPAEESKKATATVQPKYWVSERSVGEFERRFSFPGRVNQEEVKASLKNGILSIWVPKVVEKEARRINIE